MARSPVIPTAIIDSVARSRLTSREVQREFTSILNDSQTTLKVSGSARTNPDLLFAKRLKPSHKIEFFDTQFFLTDVLQIPELRFFVAYVVQWRSSKKRVVSPRIFYKDLSLCWRSASHFTYEEDGDIWIGKGDVEEKVVDGEDLVVSIESTTDLPLEMQSALESLIALSKKPKTGKGVLDLILRRSPSDRVEPYFDFVAPRVRAASNPRNRVNGGRSIAEFKLENNPRSLRITPGFEPYYAGGIVEHSVSKSRLYGGRLQRFRILSKNKKIQYMFFAGRKHVWIIPPQALTTELSSYGVRTIDVVANDDIFIPGFEYHHMVDSPNGPTLYSQIPAGFAGAVCSVDDAKADASPWLDKLPIVKAFRKAVL